MQAATPAVRAAVERLLEEADHHYRMADLGVPLLPRGSRLAIAASRRIYSAIGRRIADNGYDSVTRRAYVSLGGKLWLALGAMVAPLRSVPEETLTLAGPADRLLERWLGDAGVAL